MALTVAIGLFASRKKSEEKQSNDDFLMAGKSLGPMVLAEHYLLQILVGRAQQVLQQMFINLVYQQLGML